MKGRYYSGVVKMMIFIIDFWLINIAFVIARKQGLAGDLSNDQFTSFLLIFGLVWIVAGFINRNYRIDTTSLLRNIRNLFSTFLIHMITVGTILNSFHIYNNVRLELLAFVYLFSAFFIVGFRVLYKLVIKYFQFSGFDQRKVIIIGASNSGRTLYKYFTEKETAGYRFEGFFDDNNTRLPDGIKDRVVGTLDAEGIKNFCREKEIGEIYFSLSPAYNDLLKDLSRFADNNFIYFRIAPDFKEVIHDYKDIFMIKSVPILTNRKEPLCISLNAHLKRLFDIAFSLLVITLLFPIVIAVIALAIRLDSKGPIFFKQLRPGRKNKLFDCYKFRTMHVNNNPELQATKNDARITRVGKFLRKTNLDELPQFFNVLLGNMSVVGPRPNMVSQLEEYSKTIQNYGVRHFVTPGITGYAQVNGFRGETKEKGLMEKRVQYDVKYIENWSLGLDVKIIFLTVWNMLKGEKNAY